MKIGSRALAVAAAILAACNGDIVGGGAGGDGGDSGGATLTETSTVTATSTGTSTDCPSYSGAVAEILDTYCASCHGPGGQESNNRFDSYALASSKRGSIASEVSAGKMPPKDGASMPSTEEATLLAWIACGAPDN